MPAADKAKLQETYAKEALRLLRDAMAKGFKNVEHLKNNAGFDALRDHEEFRKLVHELEAKLKAEAGKKS